MQFVVIFFCFCVLNEQEGYLDVELGDFLWLFIPFQDCDLALVIQLSFSLLFQINFL